MLLFTRGVSLPLHYDDDSFRKHYASAMARRLRVAVYYSKGVGFDVDKPYDVHRFFRFRRTGATLTFLARTLRLTQKTSPERR